MTDATASTAAPAADTGTGTNGTPSTPPTPPAPSSPPADQILDTLNAAMAGALAIDPAAMAKTIAADLQNYLNVIFAPPKALPGDPCGDGQQDLTILTACGKRGDALIDAGSKYDAACLSATQAWQTAMGIWNTARDKYKSAVTLAQTALKVAVKAANDPYQLKLSDEARSRSAHQFFTVQQTAAAALQTYQSTVTDAATTLAAAAGTLLAACAACISAIKTAEAQQLVDAAAANQALWGSIETDHFLD